MPEDDWTWLKLAQLALAVRLGARGAEMRLQRAWEEGALTLRGIASTIPETREFVEIPASEAGHLWLDCPRSRLLRGWGRRRLTAYHSVQVRKADVERLARADVKRLGQEARTPALPPTEQAPQSASSPADMPKAEAGPLVRAVAAELRRLFPEGRPAGLERREILRRLREAPGRKFGSISLATLDRAIGWLGWPKRQSA